MKAYLSKVGVGDTCYVRVNNTIVKTKVMSIEIVPSPVKFIGEEDYIVRYRTKHFDRPLSNDEIDSTSENFMKAITRELQEELRKVVLR